MSPFRNVTLQLGPAGPDNGDRREVQLDLARCVGRGGTLTDRAASSGVNSLRRTNLAIMSAIEVRNVGRQRPGSVERPPRFDASGHLVGSVEAADRQGGKDMTHSRSSVACVLVAMSLILGACGGDDDDSADDGVASTGDAARPSEDDGNDDSTGAVGAGAGGTATFGDEELSIDIVRCYFEEQPRAGLGGVFTHTAQASGTNSAGVEIVIDMSRARGEDDLVSDDISYDVGDPFDQENFVGWSGGGPEGTLEFGDDSASGTNVEMMTFDVDGAEPMTLTFNFSC